MTNKMILAAAAIAALSSGSAYAEGNVYAGITGGTLGIGPEVGYRVNDTFGIRANATFLGVKRSFNSDDIRYRGKINLQSGGAMLDVYPFGGGFRISAGARINGNDGRVRANPEIGQTVTINDTDYIVGPDRFIRGKAETKNFAPALSLGYGGSLKGGFVFGIEAGALFQGKVRIRDFETNIPFVSPADLEAERQSIQDDVDDYKVYPILQLTVGYRF